MESFLKDTPLESRGIKNGFRSFIDPEEASADDSISAAEEEKPDSIPDSSVDEAEAIDSPTESPVESIDEITGEEVSPGDVDLKAPKSATNADDTTDPAPVTGDAVSEIVFEQVEGPKVEVISEDGDVTKIIVHLAPDKILELKCEY